MFVLLCGEVFYSVLRASILPLSEIVVLVASTTLLFNVHSSCPFDSLGVYLDLYD